MELAWNGRMGFDAAVPSGGRLSFDTYPDQGGDGGPTPIEGLVASLAACSAMDVVSILGKMRQPIRAYRVEVEWERTSEGEWPRPVARVVVRHILSGELDPDAVEKAVRLSDEKYCGVTATLRTPPQLSTTWEIEP
jgi:putative redox protein